jgi:hypothetical protein
MDAVRLGLARFINAVSLGHLKLGWWTCPYKSLASPIIIGGAPRSGTTLLRVMLDNHPDVWIGPENGVFQEAGQNLPGMEACLDLPVWTLLGLKRRSSCLGEFVDLTMARALEPHHKPIWGIKSPSVVHALDTVFHFFPRARFIHTLRDGRDVVCSLRTHPKHKIVDGRQVPTGIVNPWSSCVKTWVESTQAGLRWRHSPQYHEVRYEDLVAKPEQTIRDLLEGLGLRYDARVLRYYERSVNEGIDSPHPGTAMPVYSSAVSRWTVDLTKEGLDAFDQDACALLVSLGYASETETWKRNAAPPLAAPPAGK